MDHLTTDAERQARWYYTKNEVWPRYLPVRLASRWEDLLQIPPTAAGPIEKKQPGEPSSPAQEESEDDPSVFSSLYNYDFVYSVPFEWLLESSPSISTVKDHAESKMPRNMLRQVLDVHGFVVVSGVLSTRECQDALALAWDWMEAASEAEAFVVQQQQQQKHATKPRQKKVIHRKDLSSHSSKDGPATSCFFLPRTVEGGLMPFYGAGHSSFAWKIRSHPKVQQVFSHLYSHDTTSTKAGTGTSSNNPVLLSSLDGFVLWTEPSTDRGWFHVDQNPIHKPHAAAVQGLVHLTNVTPETGGNVLVLQSHRDFTCGHYANSKNNNEQSASVDDDAVAVFYRDRLREIGDDDWLEIDPNDEVLLHPRRLVTILLRAGDVLLWDSRVAHCSYPPRPPQKEKPPAVQPPSTKTLGFVRAATLVSMMPCDSVPEHVKDERRKAVDDNRTLTHWVDKAAPLGEERSEHVSLERDCVDFMKEQQCQRGDSRKVLLAWEDLTRVQKGLVVGER